MKKEKKDKLKMSNKAFRGIWITLMVLILLVCFTINTAANMLSTTIDTYVGAGESYISGGKDGLDGNYYSTSYKTSEESKEAAYEVAKRVSEEGSILLKNNGILPLEAGANVMPIGYAYLNPIYGQLTSGGSAKWVIDPVTPEQGLSAFSINTAAVELMEKAEVVETIEAAGTKSAGEAGSILGGDCKLYEYDRDIYKNLASQADTTGLVFVTRSGQEGQDQKYDAYEDGTPHYLALTQNEKGAIKAAKEACGKVVVILVSSAPLEMGELMEGELEADAILWVGHPSERGFATLSDLLDGNVNPSGRTVDIWTADFTADPSYQSVGEYTYSNFTENSGSYTNGGEHAVMYNEYMEGMYMGYRYYETADEMDENFVYGQLDEKGAFVEAGAVCYPFGYGLSYTSFDKKIEEVKDDGTTIEVKVKVTNTGDCAGKEVVQLYYQAPYTALDTEYKIEKPVANLIAFGKTKELTAGESQTLVLTFNWEDMTSYCYTHENYDKTVGCYMLEEGDYIISLRNNSHDIIESKNVSWAETIWYDGSDEKHKRSSDNEVATNQFQTSSDYMTTESTILTRSDWENTMPQAAASGQKEIAEEYKAQIGIENTFDPNTDQTLGNVEGSLMYSEVEPTSAAKNGLVLSDLRGADYDDERWDLLLDQIDWDKEKNAIIQNFAGDAYTTSQIDSIGLPKTSDQDGANGLKVNGMEGGSSGYDMTKSASFGFAPLMAATWNVDLLNEVGVALGQESLLNDINGWYAPAINLHRSMFSGRVFEYYSEDPVLSGKLAASVMSGAGNQGMYCYLKHFALNETDTGRADLICTWADEQTMRELYMKAFEIAIKNARMTINYYDENGQMTSKEMSAATAVMAAQNRVGTTVGECNYSLLTSVLREEWGFEGMVISDYWVWGGNNLRDLAVRAGCDSYLCIYMPMMWSISDYDSATARTAMRQAIKNICYAVVNSNAMEGLAPGAVEKVKMSPWKKGLIVNNILVLLIELLILRAIIKRAKDEKANPDKYKRKNVAPVVCNENRL